MSAGDVATAVLLGGFALPVLVLEHGLVSMLVVLGAGLGACVALSYMRRS